MALILISPPAVEPVSLAELKEFLRVDAGDTSQDDTIAGLGMSARAWAETETKRRFVLQTWRVERDFFPGYYARVTGQPGSSPVLTGPALLAGIRFAFILDYPPAWSVGNFQYQNANGVLTVLNPATDFVQDLQSNPARLTPPFGSMWPLARVTLNAVQIDYTVGYAMPILATTEPGSPPNLYGVSSTNYTFEPTDLGRPISIPGAGANGGTLNTVIAAIPSPPGPTATLRDPASMAVANQASLLVNNPNGNPGHWSMVRNAIKFWVLAHYVVRVGPLNLDRAKSALGPVRA